MSELFKIILTSSLTVIGGIIVLVVGQIITKFFIEPIHEQAKAIGEIAYSLTMYSNVYGNPGILKREKMDEASTSLRKCAGQLLARTYALKPYWFWEKLGVVRKFDAVELASKRLIGLSNFLYDPQGDIKAMNDWETEIKTVLRIGKKHMEKVNG
ncbi:MAG: hypothetical protein ACK5EU_02905 [Pseudanabaena sp.]|jgi:hypothetical protein